MKVITMIEERREFTEEDWETALDALYVSQVRREKNAEMRMQIAQMEEQIKILQRERDGWKEAYENMRDFARENGLDTDWRFIRKGNR